MDPRYNPWGTPLFPNTGSAFGVGSPAEAAERQPTFVDSLLSHIAGALGRGFMAPGQALQSTTPITSEQMIAPAQDMSTMMSVGAGAVPAQANELRMGIKAYHGSPHDFDRFDISKIGTGEGAQAYGHGLYFAENEGVAKAYRENLSRGQKSDTLVNGQPLDALPPELQSKAFTYWNTGDKSLIAGTPLETAKFEVKPPGRMYEVNLNADPAHLLDWDKPLAGQSDVAKRILQLPQVAKQEASQTAFLGPDKGLTGSSAYAAANNWRRGSELSPSNPGAITEQLREAGIPGIRYLDQGSRATTGGELIDVFKGQEGWHSKIRVDRPTLMQGAGNSITTSAPFKTEAEARQWASSKINAGSSNYVMFDDKLIDILRKYGIAGMTAPPIFAGAMSEQKQ